MKIIQAIRSKRLLCSSAVSIIEVLVAVAIAGVLFVSLYAGFSSGFAVIENARENLRATQIMVEKFETVRLYTWEQLFMSNNFIPVGFTNYYYEMGSNNNRGIAYTGTLVFASAPVGSAEYSDAIKMATVNIGWRSGNVTRTRQMSTLVGRNGLQQYVY